MKLGRSVFVYNLDQGFASPQPGIITQEYVANPNVVDVITFNPKSSHLSLTHGRDQVRFVESIDKARAAFQQGVKWICAPYDPANPESFADVEAAEAAAKTKAKK